MGASPLCKIQPSCDELPENRDIHLRGLNQGLSIEEADFSGFPRVCSDWCRSANCEDSAFFPWLESCTLILLPPHDLPLASSMASSASLIDRNLTKAKPLPFPLTESFGMKESKILTALQNIASSSGDEMDAGRLDTNKEIVFSLSAKIFLGSHLRSPDLPISLPDLLPIPHL